MVAVCKPSLALSVSQDLPALGFRAYCPLGRRIVFRDRHRSGVRKKHILQFAVFGRYLFVGEMDEPLQAYIHEGIVAVIGDCMGAWGLNPEVVRAINEAELAGEWDDIGSATNPFKVGQSVRIVAGHPFEHFVGIVRALLPQRSQDRCGYVRAPHDCGGSCSQVSGRERLTLRAKSGKGLILVRSGACVTSVAILPHVADCQPRSAISVPTPQNLLDQRGE